MSEPPYNVLFLCTGNSARSILAEALLNHKGAGRFRAYSAGSRPKGEPHPMALEVLRSHGIPAEGWSSKSWEAFAGPAAPPIDLVITVCDNAAGEVCPVWPGHPITAHWGIEDPASVEGPEQRQAFETALGHLERRVDLLIGLPIEELEPTALRQKLRDIGAEAGASRAARAGV